MRDSVPLISDGLAQNKQEIYAVGAGWSVGADQGDGMWYGDRHFFSERAGAAVTALPSTLKNEFHVTLK